MKKRIDEKQYTNNLACTAQDSQSIQLLFIYLKNWATWPITHTHARTRTHTHTHTYTPIYRTYVAHVMISE